MILQSFIINNVIAISNISFSAIRTCISHGENALHNVIWTIKLLIFLHNKWNKIQKIPKKKLKSHQLLSTL